MMLVTKAFLVQALQTQHFDLGQRTNSAFSAFSLRDESADKISKMLEN